MALAAGSRLGPYEIGSPIGAGGMGEVYKARDSKLDRDVAIKVLPESFAEDADRVARFMREAKTLASLNHPNIAAIYGLENTGTSGHTIALVMEFVDGEDLSALIARGPIAINDALPIARQIAEALETAHELGIVHRDLKPANIKVRADGTVKVLDFGLAKALDPAAASNSAVMNSPTLTAHATQMGMVIGTAAYMAPEQAKGRAVDKRADIWAFGVVLYEMLSGTRGYEAEDVSDTLAAVLTREVDWTKLPASTPLPLTGLLRDCLVRDPKQRLRDMGEARRVLDRLITGRSGSTIIAAPTSGVTAAAPIAPTWKRTLPWAIAAAAIVAAAVVTWRASSATAPIAPVTRSRIHYKDVTGIVDVSRDGTKVVYTRSAGASGFHLELRYMDQFDGNPLPNTDGGAVSIFSPVGDWIAFSTLENKIKKTQSAGGPSITLTDGSFFNGATWGDDDVIVYSGANGLLRLPASGGTPEPLTTVNKEKGESQHVRPQFLPGGTQLLFTVLSTSADPQFAVLDLKTGTYKTVARGGDNGRYAETGHLLAVRAGTLFALPFDLAHLKATGPEAPVIEGVSSVGPTTRFADYSFSRDGLLVYADAMSRAGTLLTWRDRKGAETPLVGQVPRAWGTGRLSHDGRRVANSIHGDKDTDIWVVDLARGTPARLTFGGTNDFPIWTGDDRAIVYGASVGAKPGLYEISADGSGQPRLILAGNQLVPSSITPDGKTLFYQGPDDTGKPAIMVVPLDSPGASPHRFRQSTGADQSPEVSPDGKWVAFTSDENGRSEVYVLPVSGTGAKTQVSAAGGNRPRWAANGRELLFWDNLANAALSSVTIQPAPFSASQPQKLFAAFSGTTWGATADGQHFLVESVQDGASMITVTNWFDELRRRAPAKK